MTLLSVVEHAQSPDRISQALAFSPSFYDAAMEPAKWQGVLDDLRPIFRAGIAQLNFATTADVRVLKSFWSGGTEEARQAYLTYNKFSEDPRLPGIMKNFFRPVHCRQIVKEEDWYDSAIYKDLLKPFGYDYSIVYAVTNSSESHAAVFTMLRRQQDGAFTQDDVDHLSLYAPHLRRAFEVTMRLIDGAAEHKAFAHVLDRVEAAILVMDRFGNASHVNRAGRALLDEGQHLTDAHGPIRAVDPGVAEHLTSRVFEAGLAGHDGRVYPPVKLALPGRGQTPPVYATVAALTEIGAETGGLVPDGAVVGLFITDPRRPFETDLEHLQRLFGLTATEAVILKELVERGSARKIADETGRGYETVRSHIKVIREKLGAANQADLIRIVAQSYAGMTS